MKNHGISNGLILGAVSVVITLAVYLISLDLFFNLWFQFFIGLALNIFFMSRAGLMTRRDLNGFITFGKALNPTFLTVVIGALINTIFVYILYHYIDPDLAITAKEKTLEMTENLMRSIGAPEETLDKTMSELEDQNFLPTLGKTFQQYFVSLIFGFLGAVIVSLIIKRKPPVTVSEV